MNSRINKSSTSKKGAYNFRNVDLKSKKLISKNSSKEYSVLTQKNNERNKSNRILFPENKNTTNKVLQKQYNAHMDSNLMTNEDDNDDNNDNKYDDNNDNKYDDNKYDDNNDDDNNDDDNNDDDNKYDDNNDDDNKYDDNKYDDNKYDDNKYDDEKKINGKDSFNKQVKNDSKKMNILFNTNVKKDGALLTPSCISTKRGVEFKKDKVQLFASKSGKNIHKRFKNRYISHNERQSNANDLVRNVRGVLHLCQREERNDHPEKKIKSDIPITCNIEGKRRSVQFNGTINNATPLYDDYYRSDTSQCDDEDSEDRREDRICFLSNNTYSNRFNAERHTFERSSDLVKEKSLNVKEKNNHLCAKGNINSDINSGVNFEKICVNSMVPNYKHKIVPGSNATRTSSSKCEGTSNRNRYQNEKNMNFKNLKRNNPYNLREKNKNDCASYQGGSKHQNAKNIQCNKGNKTKSSVPSHAPYTSTANAAKKDGQYTNDNNSISGNASGSGGYSDNNSGSNFTSGSGNSFNRGCGNNGLTMQEFTRKSHNDQNKSLNNYNRESNSIMRIPLYPNNMEALLNKKKNENMNSSYMSNVHNFQTISSKNIRNKTEIPIKNCIMGKQNNLLNPQRSSNICQQADTSLLKKYNILKVTSTKSYISINNINSKSFRSSIINLNNSKKIFPSINCDTSIISEKPFTHISNIAGRGSQPNFINSNIPIRHNNIPHRRDEHKDLSHDDHIVHASNKCNTYNKNEMSNDYSHQFSLLGSKKSKTHAVRTNINMHAERRSSTQTTPPSRINTHKHLINGDVNHYSKNKNYTREGMSITINNEGANFNNENKQLISGPNDMNSSCKKRGDSSLNNFNNKNMLYLKHENVKKGLTFEEMRRKSFEAIHIVDLPTNNNNFKEKNRELQHKNFHLSMEEKKDDDRNRKNSRFIVNQTKELLEANYILKKRKLNENDKKGKHLITPSSITISTQKRKTTNTSILLNDEKGIRNSDNATNTGKVNLLRNDKMLMSNFIHVKNKKINKYNNYDRLKHIKIDTSAVHDDTNEYSLSNSSNEKICIDKSDFKNNTEGNRKDEIIFNKNITGNVQEMGSLHKILGNETVHYEKHNKSNSDHLCLHNNALLSRDSKSTSSNRSNILSAAKWGVNDNSDQEYGTDKTQPDDSNDVQGSNRRSRHINDKQNVHDSRIFNKNEKEMPQAKTRFSKKKELIISNATPVNTLTGSNGTLNKRVQPANITTENEKMREGDKTKNNSNFSELCECSNGATNEYKSEGMPTEDDARG
ncbi:hypothetical protein PMALA_056710, partial [Plasmodium malariae]